MATLSSLAEVTFFLSGLVVADADVDAVEVAPAALVEALGCAEREDDGG